MGALLSKKTGRVVIISKFAADAEGGYMEKICPTCGLKYADTEEKPMNYCPVDGDKLQTEEEMKMAQDAKAAADAAAQSQSADVKASAEDAKKLAKKLQSENDALKLQLSQQKKEKESTATEVETVKAELAEIKNQRRHDQIEHHFKAKVANGEMILAKQDKAILCQ